jgi:hypothetical protein
LPIGPRFQTHCTCSQWHGLIVKTYATDAATSSLVVAGIVGRFDAGSGMKRLIGLSFYARRRKAGRCMVNIESVDGLRAAFVSTATKSWPQDEDGGT